MIRLDDLQVFVQTADAGSFSAAARLIDTTPAMASNAVQRLEKELGTRLFVRSTRSMRLSDDGERYLPHARAMLASLAGGSQALAEARGEIAGPLRLSLPSDLGRNVLVPWLDEFQTRHPRLSLQLWISDRAADLLRHPIDAAIRYGALDDSGDVAADIAAGRLVELLPGLGQHAPVNMVSAHRAQLTPAVQHLRDFLRERLAALAP
jgi:DNA-binding transcriptional LysR family regulator